MEEKKSHKKFIILFTILATVGICYGSFKWLHAQAHEETDDAQIQKNMNPIIPKVAGYIEKVYVKDNQYVKKGDTLLIIDPRDYLVKVTEAEAALIGTQSMLEVAKSNVHATSATIHVSDANIKSSVGNVEVAKIRLERAQNDFKRYENLYKDHSITKQQYEQALAAKQEAEKEVEVLQQQQQASTRQRQAVVSQTEALQNQIKVAYANVKQAQAALEASQLNLGYTVIKAAVDGQVSNIALQPGQMIQPGQALFYIVNDQDTWIVANFKETQLNKIRAGQKVIIIADAYPDMTFEGEVDSFSPATGARFSILPPDNATGNFVKTIQRLSVKIKLTPNNDAENVKLLRSGMNVEIDVHIK